MATVVTHSSYSYGVYCISEVWADMQSKTVGEGDIDSWLLYEFTSNSGYQTFKYLTRKFYKIGLSIGVPAGDVFKSGTIDIKILDTDHNYTLGNNVGDFVFCRATPGNVSAGALADWARSKWLTSSEWGTMTVAQMKAIEGTGNYSALPITDAGLRDLTALIGTEIGFGYMSYSDFHNSEPAFESLKHMSIRPVHGSNNGLRLTLEYGPPGETGVIGGNFIL